MSKEEHDERAAHGRAEQADKPWMLECLNLLSPHLRGGERVLDIGSGNGETADLLTRQKGCSVTCLDYAPSHLERTRKKGYETLCCHLERGDEAARLAVEKRETFDVVTCLEVVEHLFNPDSLFQLAHSVLKPGGLLAISTPNLAYASYRLYSLFRGNLPAGQGHHVAFFDAHRLRQYLFVCGFDIAELIHFSAGEFYLDRAMGIRCGRARRWLIRALFQACLRLGPESLRHSEIIALARKASVPPLAISGLSRETLFKGMSREEQTQALGRLMPAIRRGMFDDHPDFVNSCERMWNRNKDRE